MGYGLLVLGSFIILGFTDIKDCMDARDVVARQVEKPVARNAAVCVPLPRNAEIIGGARSTVK